MRDKPGNILLAFCAIEIISCSLFLHWGWREAASITYFIGGLGVAITPVIAGNKAPAALEGYKVSYWYYYLFIATITYCFGYFIYDSYNAILGSKLDIHYADMLVVIDELSGRFVEGKQIYAPIDHLWQGFQPKYLPMMWLPFVPAKWANIDIRWTTVVFLIIGVSASLIAFKRRKLTIYTIGVCTLLSLMFWYLIIRDHNFTILTQEGVIVCFYLLLGYAIFNKNYYLQGLMLAVCVLSRYSFTFWLPMYFIFVFILQSRKDALKMLATFALSVLFILFFSGAYKELDTFLSLQGNYLAKISKPENVIKFDKVIRYSLGLSKFWEYKNLKYLHYLTLACSVLVPFLFLALAWFKRNTWNLAFFGICSLKLTLVFFFNLLPLPYLYLFYTSSFFSLVILHRYLNRHLQPSGRF